MSGLGQCVIAVLAVFAVAVATYGLWPVIGAVRAQRRVQRDFRRELASFDSRLVDEWARQAGQHREPPDS